MTVNGVVSYGSGCAVNGTHARGTIGEIPSALKKNLKANEADTDSTSLPARRRNEELRISSRSDLYLKKKSKN